MDNWELIGYAASILGAATLIPEVLSALKSRHLNDLAWGFLIIAMSSNALWLLYAIKMNIIPLLLSATLSLVCALILVILKNKFKTPPQPTMQEIVIPIQE